jgi:hypothetical protein
MSQHAHDQDEKYRGERVSLSEATFMKNSPARGTI